MLGEHLAADLGGIGRRGRHVRIERLHDVAAERLLLVGALHHEHVQIEPEMRRRLGERRAPLARTRLGGDAVEILSLRVISLGDGRVQLVRAGRVVAFELVVDLGGRAEGLLQVVRAAQGRRAVDAVHLQHRFGDVDVGRVVVQLLAHQLVAEHRCQILRCRDLAVRQPDGLRLLRHVGPQVVPLRRDLVFAQVQTMRCLFGHGRFLSNRSVPRLARRGCSQSASVRAARTKRAPGSPRALLISMCA